jgi:hypothetical protein
LGDIYTCQKAVGSIVAALGSITQAKCQMMIDYLTMHVMPSLIKAGTPDGTKIAHKHGWVTDAYGVINVIQDAGIVYTPGRYYVLVVFYIPSQQLLWDKFTKIIADLSRNVLYTITIYPKPNNKISI